MVTGPGMTKRDKMKANLAEDCRFCGSEDTTHVVDNDRGTANHYCPDCGQEWVTTWKK